MNTGPLSAGELRSLLFLWEKHQDLTCYVDWESIKPRLREHHEEIWDSWMSYRAACKALKVDLQDACDEAAERDDDDF